MGFEPQRRGASSFKVGRLNHSATEAPTAPCTIGLLYSVAVGRSYVRSQVTSYSQYMNLSVKRKENVTGWFIESCICACIYVCIFVSVSISLSVRGLRGRVVKASRCETTRPSPLGFESHERYLSVASGRLLVHSQEQFVPPAVETDSHI